MSELSWNILAEPHLSLFINCFLLVMCALIGLQWQSGQRKLRALQRQLDSLKQEFRALNSGTLGMGRKLTQMAAELSQPSLEGVVTDSENESKPYQQAALLLERGATIEEVVDCCDLPAAEVELLAVMRHSMKQNRQPAQAATH